ncbi:hypothetical protein [Streptomyces sp. NPDC052036]|uniref:hypothetical protein n=1 Tax=Streptomyces sp. NPDC052036 TaxID=3155171 RepID=UPI003426C645
MLVDDVEADDGGDLVVVAGDQAGTTVDGAGGQAGAWAAGQECQQTVGDWPTSVRRPGQCPHLAATVEVRRDVRPQQRREQFTVLGDACPEHRTGDDIVLSRCRGLRTPHSRPLPGPVGELGDFRLRAAHDVGDRAGAVPKAPSTNAARSAGDSDFSAFSTTRPASSATSVGRVR